MSNDLSEPTLSQEEKDILQEVMNIAFGKASADLAEVIDIFVHLNIPDIEIIRTAGLPEYIRGVIKEQTRISIVEQNFLGKFSGVAMLVFPTGAGKEIFSMLSPPQPENVSVVSLALLEKESLLEIGNILIGACVGKIAELLDDIVTYSPPRVIIESTLVDSVQPEIFDPTSSAIIMQTIFSFQGKDINGYLFLLNNPESLGWLKKALLRFLERFA